MFRRAVVRTIAAAPKGEGRIVNVIRSHRRRPHYQRKDYRHGEQLSDQTLSVALLARELHFVQRRAQRNLDLPAADALRAFRRCSLRPALPFWQGGRRSAPTQLVRRWPLCHCDHRRRSSRRFHLAFPDEPVSAAAIGRFPTWLFCRDLYGLML
jgi:hypothetical protein